MSLSCQFKYLFDIHTVAFRTAPIILYLFCSFHDGPPKLEGVLQVNHKLQKVKKLFQDEIIGPESYTIDSNGVIYTGSADGKIWKISGETAQVLMTTGSNHSGCGKFHKKSVSYSESNNIHIIFQKKD